MPGLPCSLRTGAPRSVAGLFSSGARRAVLTCVVDGCIEVTVTIQKRQRCLVYRRVAFAARFCSRLARVSLNPYDVNLHAESFSLCVKWSSGFRNRNPNHRPPPPPIQPIPSVIANEVRCIPNYQRRLRHVGCGAALCMWRFSAETPLGTLQPEACTQTATPLVS